MLDKLKLLSFHVWAAGLLNVLLVADALRIIVANRSVENVSVLMWTGFIYVQVTLAVAGHKAKQRGQMISMALSALVSITVVVLCFLWG